MASAFHILIVDDNPNNIKVAMSALQEDGHSFSFATSGQEGLDLVATEPERFDLILLDIMMPNMDGYEMCGHLKNDPIAKDIPIIFLTAKTDIDAITKGISLGAVDYILKPFHGKELRARVNNHLELSLAKKLLENNNIELKSEALIAQKKFLTELEKTQLELIFILTELIEARSDETGKHIRRMAKMSSLLAKYHPDMNEQDEHTLLHAAPMHDIGKMMIPPEILHKPGSYTEEEFAVMKEHAEHAYNLLKRSDHELIHAAAIIARQHHEHWSGKGYPQQLSGEDIHIYGRIVALADVFDALTHNRCYKEAWEPQKALEYIQGLKGDQFDPQLVDIFAEHFDEFVEIC